MKRTTVARVIEADARLERITHLAEQLAPAPVNSLRHLERQNALVLRILHHVEGTPTVMADHVARV